MIFDFEVCQNCEEHAWCTHHDEDKYVRVFLECQQLIESSIPNSYCTFNQGIQPGTGSFEIRNKGILIYSKKNTQLFPQPPLLVERIKKFIDDIENKRDVTKWATKKEVKYQEILRLYLYQPPKQKKERETFQTYMKKRDEEERKQKEQKELARIQAEQEEQQKREEEQRRQEQLQREEEERKKQQEMEEEEKRRSQEKEENERLAAEEKKKIEQQEQEQQAQQQQDNQEGTKLEQNQQGE